MIETRSRCQYGTKRGFITPLALIGLRGKNRYRLTNPLVYITINDQMFVVPRLFITDFATIPRIFLSIIDDDEARIRDAAVLHDFLYSAHSSPDQLVTRLRADQLLIESMLTLGAPWWMRVMVYAAVRVAGRRYYKK